MSNYSNNIGHLLLVLAALAASLTGACGGRSGPLLPSEASVFATDGGTDSLVPSCTGSTPWAVVDGVALPVSKVAGVPAPPFSCCYATVFRFSVKTASGAAHEVDAMIKIMAVSSMAPPTTLNLAQPHPGWDVSVTHRPCESSAGCSASGTLSTVNKDTFSGYSKLEGNPGGSPSGDLCLTASAGPSSSGSPRSVKLYTPAISLRWF